MKERNYGVDLLRIVAMYFVVIIHILSHGGILNNLNGTVQYSVTWLLYNIVGSAVNIYILISGYVCYRGEESEYGYKRYIRLWLQALFYSVLIRLCFGKTGTIEDFLFSFFPITSNQWWFFSIYTALFFFMPIINGYIRKCSEAEVKKTVFICLSIFCIYTTIVSPIADPLGINGGYSFVWFVIVYMLGAMIKKTGILKEYCIGKLIIVLLCLIIFPWFMKTIGSFMMRYLLGMSFGEDFLMAYSSPTTLLAAVFYMAIFLKLKLSNKMKKVISAISPYTFGVYLIHDNRLIRSIFIEDKFLNIADLSGWKIPVVVMGIAIVIMCSCMLIDYVRARVFKMIERHIGKNDKCNSSNL